MDENEQYSTTESSSNAFVASTSSTIQIKRINVEDLEEDSDEDDDHNAINALHQLYVHAGTLERFCQRDTHATHFEVTWAEWAAHVRLMPKFDYESIWTKGPVSHRRLLVPENLERRSTIPLALYDFPSPPALRRAASLENQRGPWQYILEPEVLDSPKLFRSPVVSGLPYRKVVTDFVKRPEKAGECILTGDYMYLHKRNSYVILLVLRVTNSHMQYRPWRVLSFC